MLALGVTGLAGRLDGLVPRDVVRSVQAAVGVKLLVAGLAAGVFVSGGIELRPFFVVNGLAVFTAATVFFGTCFRKPVLAVLPLVAVGLVLALRGLPAGTVAGPSMGFSMWRPSFAAFDSHSVAGLWKAVLLHGSDENVFRGRGAGPPLEEALASFAGRYEVALVEGHKGTDVPKVWLLSEGEASPPPEVRGVVATLRRDADRAAVALPLLERAISKARR
jgi:hypothetical protein